MKISQKMGLNKSQYELDFFDFHIEQDNYAFIDPYYIAKKEDEFLRICNEYVETFFDRFLMLLNEDEDAAYDLFSHLGEVNEICLGMSQDKPKGKGVGREDSRRIFNAIKESEAFKTGVAERLEDVKIFVKGIDVDKISDMVANIIKIPLIEYTQEQCKLYGIQTTSIEAGYCWNKDTWERGHKEMLLIDGKPYILYPKNMISTSDCYCTDEYFRMYVLEHLKKKHLQNNTDFVHRHYNNKGKITSERVFKKELKENFSSKGIEINKNWFARFTRYNPEVFRQFKERTIEKVKADKESQLTDEDVCEVIDVLIDTLKSVPTGRENATEYHHLVFGILELLFYPCLTCPKIEQEINEGRKRVDITFANSAEKGFFSRLGTLYNVSCTVIMIECKNYSKDINNPELDQMAGRFSARRGQFGIICCRSLDDNNAFLKRERDTVKDGRGYIIHFTDEDLIALLNLKKQGADIDDYLTEKYKEILM
jgi:hypothetical protein